MSRRALVTGASGFVGSHLARHLVESGWKVHVILRENSDISALEPFQDRLVIHRYHGQVAEVIAIMKAAHPDVVFHLASLFLSSHSAIDIEPLISANLVFASQIVEAAKTVGVGCLVNAGTAWQFFSEDGAPARNNYNPVCLYAATKEAFEKILEFYVQAHDLHVVTLYLFDTYGPNDRRPKLIAALKRAAESEEILSMSGGDQILDLLHIDDACAAFLKAAERSKGAGDRGSFERFALSSGDRQPLKAVVETASRVLGKPIRARWGERPYRFREVMNPWSAGLSLPGWVPRYKLEEGLRTVFTAGADLCPEEDTSEAE